MEMISRRLSKKIKPTTIYADEADEIIKIISQTSERIYVTASQYKLSKEDKISDIQNDITDLEIDGSGPSIWLVLNGRDCHFTYSDEIPVSVVENIEKVLNRGSNLWWRFFYSWWPFALLSAWMTSISIIPFEIIEPAAKPILALGGFLLIIISINSLAYLRNRLYCVRTDKRKHSPSFIKRNKDSIAVGIIVSIVSASITWLGTSPKSPFQQKDPIEQTDAEKD